MCEDKGFDYSKLRGLIREKLGSEAAFAKEMGLSSASLSGRLTGKLYFTQKDIRRACAILGIPTPKIHTYFFVEKV